MSIEFTVNDLGSMEDIETLMKVVGENAKGERFVLYTTELHNRPMGGLIRLEDANASGFEVGRVGMTTSSFSRPILTMTTFNSCNELTARLMSEIALDTWRQKTHRMEFEAHG